jgi:hypothetical protein
LDRDLFTVEMKRLCLTKVFVGFVLACGVVAEVQGMHVSNPIEQMNAFTDSFLQIRRNAKVILFLRPL